MTNRKYKKVVEYTFDPNIKHAIVFIVVILLGMATLSKYIFVALLGYLIALFAENFFSRKVTWEKIK
jgi:hypothetical protein